ncbi:MAG TPA: type II secretion system protein N [Burkholderiales bacterium]|nr:type II secretion system protein N [Burkholderiales bacterium]
MKFLFALLQRSGFGILNLALLIALCAMAAKWTWIFLTPVTPVVPAGVDMPAGDAAETIIDHRLLNNRTVMNLPPPNLVLEGVFAATNGSGGVAILRDGGGKSMMVPSTAQIQPGMRLDGIYRDHVVIDRDGVKSRLNLKEDAPPLTLN